VVPANHCRKPLCLAKGNPVLAFKDERQLMSGDNSVMKNPGFFRAGQPNLLEEPAT